MARFRKKLVEIEAVRWTGDNLKEVLSFTGIPSSTEIWTRREYEDMVKEDGLPVFTLSGKVNASIDDWIIRGVKGEFYPCKPDIFRETYEEVS